MNLESLQDEYQGDVIGESTPDALVSEFVSAWQTLLALPIFINEPWEIWRSGWWRHYCLSLSKFTPCRYEGRSSWSRRYCRRRSTCSGLSEMAPPSCSIWKTSTTWRSWRCSSPPCLRRVCKNLSYNRIGIVIFNGRGNESPQSVRSNYAVSEKNPQSNEMEA